MRKLATKIVCLCLTLSLLLSGCGVVDFGGYLGALGNLLQGNLSVRFEDMAYIRPDVEAILRDAKACIEAAETEKDPEVLAQKIWDFYWQYNDFYTSYYLAYIRYCADLTDIYWEKENSYCMEKSMELDAALDQIHYALADSPLRQQLETEDLFGKGYFDGYEGDSLWDEQFLALMEQESQLISRYYALCDDALETEYYSESYFTEYGSQMVELYVDMIRLRQEMASYAGYEDYVSFAYDFYYYRDYTPAQALAYCEQVQKELVPLYRQINLQGGMDDQSQKIQEQDMLTYVKDMANAMGGIVLDAFTCMENGGLYDISYSPNKYASSFEVYLPIYSVPYIFLCPSLWSEDKLVFAHEFGHFCSDYASGGSEAGIDVAEIFSQGMEYLSLCYGDEGKNMAKLKLADGLIASVEQAAYASFEQRVYALKGDDLTAENVLALYEEVCRSYGFDTWDWDSRDLVCINHFFTYPMYVISYVVSNDAAIQLYQLEQKEAGMGLAVLQESLATEEQFLLSYLNSVGLKSPFAEERVNELRATFEKIVQ